MIKHVGKQGDRRVAIVFREVPGEEHMCLVVYPDLLASHLHDGLMSAIESTEGQAAENLGDALHSKLFNDGRPILQTLHGEGMLKKVQTETVTVTPTPSSSVRLDELNKVLREMATGEEAVKRMAEIDADAGYTGKASRKDDYGREIGAPPPSAQRNAPLAGSNNPTTGQVLGDSDIANNLKAQAEKMAVEAQGLLAESERMLKEAREMLGESEPKKRGRKPKAKVANAG